MHASGNIFESILNTSSFDMIYVFISKVLGQVPFMTDKQRDVHDLYLLGNILGKCHLFMTSGLMFGPGHFMALKAQIYDVDISLT
jgi:hypothetical protein